MKYFSPAFLLITLFSLFNMSASSQNPVKTYDKEWAKAEDLVKKGLPQSALAEVKKIYELAKKEKQDAQVIKAVIYMTSLQDENRENNVISSIKEMEKEIFGSKEPVTSILNSLTAGLYWNYYQQNRYKFYNRTATAEFVKDDIATWGAEDFHKKISALYLASLANDKLLKQTKLEPFDAVIVKGNMRHLRPTLYDLLAHRALSYFENDERDVNKPAYAFEIDQAAAFDPVSDFIYRKFVTKDSLSLYHKALLLYQQLIAFHINDTRPDALIDVDLKRIQFVRAKSVHPDKEQDYFNAVNHIAHQYENTPAAAQAWYLVADYYEQRAAQYKANGDTAHRYDRLKAKEICERVLAQKDSSEGKINCYNLMQQLRSAWFSFEIEKVNLPGQPFRALIEYKNVNTLYLRMIRADDNLKKLLENQYDEKYWPAIIAAKSVKSWEQKLPATNDLQQHSTEIKIDALPAGDYILLAGTNSDMAVKKTILGARPFYVSSISFVNNNEDFFVLNRDNGQPLTNAVVQVWEQKYDYKTSKYTREKAKQYKTDDKGFFKMNGKKDTYGNYNYLLDITSKGERLFMGEMINNYYYRDEEATTNKSITSIFLFGDRSIYRPGQTVFFKGIVLTRNNQLSSGDVLSGYSTTVYLRDANYQAVDSMKVKTNEFGSFSGKFQLPSSGLNGAFSIVTKKDNGNLSFRVEEYKRPKFYVDYEPLKGTYKVDDKIKITGIAKAYAGNNIDGALVKYRVVRQPRFIYTWFFKRWWQPPTEPLEITHGEMQTDKDGKFVIAFEAIPDLKIDKKLDPLFDYTVYADITDVNGETRSGQQLVTVGYKALLLKTAIPSSLPVDSLKNLWIRTENMNGEFETARINVTVTKLKEEKRLIRERYWEKADQFVMTKNEYINNFPNDEYDNESDPETWEKEKESFVKNDSARVNSKFSMEGSKFAPGFYVIEISTKDKNGEEVKDKKYIELYDDKSKEPGSSKYLWTVGSNPIEPGEKTSVRLGTTAEDLFIIQQLDKNAGNINKPATYSFFALSKEKKTIDFLATEADRGGYGASWIFVKHNRVFQYNETITVPWTNKDLTIEYATYRDKALPGSEEKWKIKISGYKKEKIAAEMLGSMYDASLDQFYAHSWNKPYLWTSYYMRTSWDGSQNFIKTESMPHLPDGNTIKDLVKNYDELMGDTYTRIHIRASNEMFIHLNAAPRAFSMDSKLDEAVVVGYGGAKKKTAGIEAKEMESSIDGIDKSIPPAQAEKAPAAGEVQIRKNFNETAFFLPELRTDSSGAIEFSFTLPEALTKWKFQALAHTKGLAFGYSSKEIVTQKQLMVQPNAPRFLREGDKMEFSAKIVNMTEKEFTGTAEFQLFDAATNEPVDGRFQNAVPNQYFTVAAGQSEAVKFPIEVPYQFNKALTWRIVARANEYSDGEENSLPVLTNRMLVTETMSLPMKGNGKKEFSFEKLLNSGKSETLQHQSLTIEYTSNPAWYAVQALPYLMEYPYECAEQNWNRYYANSLASFIATSSPRIRQVFEQWKNADTAALLSNLQKNQELKAILLEETPWVLQAKSEAQQKKNIGLLFDMIKMSDQLNSSFEKLKQLQSSNGGFVWFKGGPDDRYITQYIVTGIGHLRKLKGIAASQEAKLNTILATALPYLDRKIKEDYDNLIKYKTDLKKYVPDYSAVHYLYMRSFFPDQKIAAASQAAYNYFKSRLPLAWTEQNKYMQGMIALALSRTGDTKTPAAILKSLKETAIVNDELGMYWKDASRSWWWYEAPIERQALLIEAFQEIGKDTRTVDDLRTWLLKNKQTNNWESTKATAEACYALLIQGTEWLTDQPLVQITVGKTVIRSDDNKQEAGTGYFKKTIDGPAVKPEMGNIVVSVSSSNNASAGKSSWGGIYWQYFEDLDKITTAATPLKLVKKLFIEKNTDRGPVLTPINDGDQLNIGDKIKVRVELRVDRDMEYVHMKDMRAAALEPVNVLSSYKWQGGLGYYESTKDASTNFFFSQLRKGTYVFEYPLFITHAGNFSNGITTIQCMYAPEFSAHSEGVRLSVKDHK